MSSDYISQAMRDRFRLPARKTDAQGGYSDSFKETVYEAVDEGLTIREIAKRYNLTAPEIVAMMKVRYA